MPHHIYLRREIYSAIIHTAHHDGHILHFCIRIIHAYFWLHRCVEFIGFAMTIAHERCPGLFHLQSHFSTIPSPPKAPARRASAAMLAYASVPCRTGHGNGVEKRASLYAGSPSARARRTPTSPVRRAATALDASWTPRRCAGGAPRASDGQRAYAAAGRPPPATVRSAACRQPLAAGRRDARLR